MLVFISLLGLAYAGFDISALGITRNDLGLTPVDSGGGASGSPPSPYLEEKQGWASYSPGPYLENGKWTTVSLHLGVPNKDYYIEITSSGQTKYSFNYRGQPLQNRLGWWPTKSVPVSDLYKFYETGQFESISSTDFYRFSQPSKDGYIGDGVYAVKGHTDGTGEDTFQVGGVCVYSSSDILSSDRACSISDVKFRVIVPGSHVYAAVLFPVQHKSVDSLWWNDYNGFYDFTKWHEIRVRLTYQDGSPWRPPLMQSISNNFTLTSMQIHRSLILPIRIMMQVRAADHEEVSNPFGLDPWQTMIGSDGYVSYFYPERGVTGPHSVPHSLSYPDVPLQIGIQDYQATSQYAYEITDGSISGIPVASNRLFKHGGFSPSSSGAYQSSYQVYFFVWQMDLPTRGDSGTWKWIVTTDKSCGGGAHNECPYETFLKLQLEVAGWTDAEINDFLADSSDNPVGQGFMHVGSKLFNAGCDDPRFPFLHTNTCAAYFNQDVPAGLMNGYPIVLSSVDGRGFTFIKGAGAGFGWPSAVGTTPDWLPMKGIFAMACPGMTIWDTTGWAYYPDEKDLLQPGYYTYNAGAHPRGLGLPWGLPCQSGTFKPYTNFLFVNPITTGATVKAVFSNTPVLHIIRAISGMLFVKGDVGKAGQVTLYKESDVRESLLPSPFSFLPYGVQLSVLGTSDLWGAIPLNIDLAWFLIALPIALALIIIGPRRIFGRKRRRAGHR